jgi:hypothetical protein
VPDTPPKKPKDEVSELDAGWGEDDSGVSERPTVAPPFDLESYAKETAIPSSNVVLKPDAPVRMIPAQTGGLPPRLPGERRGSLEDRIDEMLSGLDERAPGAQGAALRAPSDTAITMPPPPPAAGPPSDPLSRRETPQGTAQIEQARALSARADFGTGSLLSLANMRAPSNAPPRAAPDDPVLTYSIEEEGDTEGVGDPIAEMQERFALGDYSGALVMAESLLEDNPSHVEAREYAESCRAVLQQMYAAKIGPLTRVPIVEVARDQMRWLSIDHRAGFMLSLVDGVSSLEMILDVSGMPYLDALRILYELVQQRIISLRED